MVLIQDDFFRLRVQAAGRVTDDIPGFVPWFGYQLPRASSYRWQDLIKVAWANAFRLSPQLLRKWRQWRFIPGPRAGGPTGKGPGKGETWPHAAGWRVAWMSRWLADSLSYDTLRMSIWPWTYEFEADRVRDLKASAAKFIRQDQDFHDRSIQARDLEDESLAAYQAVVMTGEGSARDHRLLLQSAGVSADSPGFARAMDFIARLNIDDMAERFERLDADALPTFINDFRASVLAQHEKKLVDDFWKHPLGLARIVVRELYRWLLVTSGELPR